MGRPLLSVPVAALAALSWVAWTGPAVAVPLATGDLIPRIDLQMLDAHGKLASIDNFRGDSGTMVVFASNSCSSSTQWEGRIAALALRYQEQLVMTVLVSSNDPTISPEDGSAGIREISQRLGARLFFLADDTSAIARAFGATRNPEVFLFSGQGKLVYHGAVDDNAGDPDQVTEPFLEDALEALVTGRPLPVPETQPVGCPIRFRE